MKPLAMWTEAELESMTDELFALRRRVIELTEENRKLRMLVPRPHATAPAVPATGFALGISDGSGVRELAIAGRYAKFGTHASCNVNLPGARNLHAIVERAADGTVTVNDFGTTEGTWLNGVRITKTTPMRSGDHLNICDAHVIVVFP